MGVILISVGINAEPWQLGIESNFHRELTFNLQEAFSRTVHQSYSRIHLPSQYQLADQNFSMHGNAVLQHQRAAS